MSGIDTEHNIPSHLAVKVFYLQQTYECEKQSYEKAKSLQGGIVPRIYGVTTWHDGHPAIVMQFLDGKTASSAICDPGRAYVPISDTEIFTFRPRFYGYACFIINPWPRRQSVRLYDLGEWSNVRHR